ncbi:unnamed protein product [Cylicostephanus goldi]|uniref:UGGT thioredoxin-like domain-containing protein n=1 Tax=Cylicostephanus goldi TaxID=71465 RepID=A0A3P6RGW6_CYLGO|nr:unnamed protein product [Cylicostephanus goldi]
MVPYFGSLPTTLLRSPQSWIGTKVISTHAHYSASDEQKYEFALEVAAGILDEPSMDILKLSLSYRMFSPAVHLFQQVRHKPLIASDYSVDCAAFFDVHGTTGCTSKGLEDAVNSASQRWAYFLYEMLMEKLSASKERSVSMPFSASLSSCLLLEKIEPNCLRDVPELLSTDHVNGKDSSPKTVVIIYGDIGSQDWLQLHNKALELSASNKAQYVLRHFQKNTISARSVSLSGYGVELAIKNTEYKAVDDSNVKKEEAEETSLHGFNFKLLKELHPDAAESLDAFRIHLKEIEELAPLKQWQVQDLSFQVALKVSARVRPNAYLPRIQSLFRTPFFVFVAPIVRLANRRN